MIEAFFLCDLMDVATVHFVPALTLAAYVIQSSVRFLVVTT